MKMPATPKPSATSAVPASRMAAAGGGSMTPPVVASANAAKTPATATMQPAGARFQAPKPPAVAPPPARTRRGK